MCRVWQVLSLGTRVYITSLSYYDANILSFSLERRISQCVVGLVPPRKLIQLPFVSSVMCPESIGSHINVTLLVLKLV
jgi:hypothetical protein